MSIYDELNIEKIINASDTYTRIGGSRMSQRTLAAYEEAGQNFVDIGELSDAICKQIAKKTNNETAFISSGAAGCVVLSASACMTMGDETAAYHLPDTSLCKKNEIIIFESQKNCPMLPYWHLIELSGANLITVPDSVSALGEAITEKTAAIYIFAGTVYEWTTPKLSLIISIAHQYHVPVIVDAAAQLPPKSLLSYYTVDLGADAVIFSGGKFINAPQTTGFILGKHNIIDHMKTIASPNVKIGRPYKVGKEEYAAFYRAFMDFIELDEEKRYQELKNILVQIQSSLISSSIYESYIEEKGRLGQHIPMLYLNFFNGITGKECYDFMYDSPNRVDIGIFNSLDPTGAPNRIFINAINLRNEDIPILIEKLNQWISKIS
ncbi:MAG: aminotransferase class V-fold PLP-dependent enzyme [Lachnospiraceae bacterium]